MDRASIDGRGRTKSATPSAKQKRKAEAPPVKLRPASPPKSNPWGLANKRTAKPAAEKFPPLPKPQMAQSSATTTPATGTSRKSSTSSCEPQSRDETALVAASASPSSVASSASRLRLEAAASRATANLWDCPIGADVVVRAGVREFRVHRNIVVAESGWFRDHLPPPNKDGTPVEIFVEFAPEAVGHCLLFIYKRDIDICQNHPEEPWYALHLPRCALGYCAAVSLQVPKLASYLLQIIENTSIQLGRLIQTEHLNRSLECSEWSQFSWCYQAAMDLLIHERAQKLMMPMRLALAGLLDAIFFWLMRQPLFLSVFQSTWQRLLQSSVPYIAEHRRRTRDANPYTDSPLANEAALRKLFDEVEEERRQFQKQAKRRVFTENGLILLDAKKGDSDTASEGGRGRRGSL